MTFPIDQRSELQLGGVWTDISDDVRTGTDITIARGRRSGAGRTDPSKCTVQLNNRHGKYSPDNPMSPYWGLLGRNTPFRVSVPAASTYLALPGTSGADVTTPDHASLGITGDIDIRLDVQLDNWVNPLGTLPTELTQKYTSTGNQRSWQMYCLAGGRLALAWSEDGVAVEPVVVSTATLPVPGSGRLALRATLDTDDGAGGHTVTFYTAASLAGPWAQLGDPVTGAGTTSIFDSTAPIEIGNGTSSGGIVPLGEAYAFQLRDGIDGTVVASPDFTSQAAGATSFADSSGRTWTVVGDAEISDRNYRIQAEIPAWPEEWDPSGADVWVTIQAAGNGRRLGQGRKALGSTLRRRIPSFPGVVSYHPMEEDRDATQIYSPTPGAAPLTATGFAFASDDTLDGSATLPEINAAATLTGTIPAPATATGQWSLQYVYNLDGVTPPVTDAEVFAWRTNGTVTRWRILYRSGIATVEGYTIAGTLLVDSGIGIGSDVFTGWNRQIFRVSESGGTVTWRILWQNLGGEFGAVTDTYSGTAGRVTAIDTGFGAALSGMSIGHLAVFDVSATNVSDAADSAFDGEPAHSRMIRLGAEESVPIAIAADPGTVMALGPQRPATLATLLQDAADADGGILFEHRKRTALKYRGRTTLYHQTPVLELNYTGRGEIIPPLRPNPDDLLVRNDVTARRVGGSSGRYVRETGPLNVQDPADDPQGVGPYDEEIPLNLATDDVLEGIAAWHVHLGTATDPRYPVVHLSMAAAPHLIPAVLDLDIGDRITIANLPAGRSPENLDLIVQGYTERLNTHRWDLELNCTPGRPWDTATAGGSPADTDGSELSAAIDTDDTVLSVAVTAGPLWLTGTILSPNPTLEVNLTGWSGSGATIARVPTPPGATFGGNWSLEVTPDGVAGFPQAASSLIAVTAGTEYRAAAWLWSELALATGINLNWFDVGLGYLSTDGDYGTLTPRRWEEYDATATAPPGAVWATIGPSCPASGAVTDVVVADMLRMWDTANTLAAELPLDIKAGGERMTITAISGASSPQAMTVIRSVNRVTKAHAAGTSLTLARRTVPGL